MVSRAKKVFIGVAAFLAVIQLVRPAHTNPPIDPSRGISARLSVDPAVQDIFNRSCNDCHSNKTVWPWYSNIAPVSWLVWRDVTDGRRHMNLSDFRTAPIQREGHTIRGICEETRGGDMPMSIYVPMHPLSKLSSSDVEKLCQWSDGVIRTLPPEAMAPMRRR